MANPRPVPLKGEALRRQKKRNWALFAVLLAFVVLIFTISVVKMGGS